MIRTVYLAAILFLTSCRTTTYYIVRHAEKDGGSMSSDPALTPAGEKQALDLKNFLQHKKIAAIYTTNFLRTRSTAQPLSTATNLPIHFYTQANSLADSLKGINTGNVLIVGHSNTVDDLVNRFMDRRVMSDLADNEYGNIFIVKKKGKTYSFERRKVPPVLAPNP